LRQPDRPRRWQAKPNLSRRLELKFPNSLTTNRFSYLCLDLTEA
jgi:hypothetical protein